MATFDECVMKEVSFEFSEQELEQEGEMFRKRCGSGLSAAYANLDYRRKTVLGSQIQQASPGWI